MSSDPHPELDAVPELVSTLIELLDPQKILEIDINELISLIMNFQLRPKHIKIEEFVISRAIMPIPDYSPGLFPQGFNRIASLKEIISVIPQILWIDFVITAKDESKIKAKGIGELSIYRNNGEVRVEARDLWSIEEIKEIEPEEDIEKRTNKLSKFIKEVVLALVAKVLAELGSRAITKK